MASLTASDEVYRSPQILADLGEAGEQVSGETVAKLMRRAEITGISPRGFVPVTTQAGPDAQPVLDLVGRPVRPGPAERVWTSDFERHEAFANPATGEGWLYLCAVRDRCSRRVVAWAVEDHLCTDLVKAALRRAVTLRGELPGKVIFHADRGASTPPSRSPTPAPNCPCSARWAGLGSAGTTLPQHWSGRAQDRVLTRYDSSSTFRRHKPPERVSARWGEPQRRNIPGQGFNQAVALT